MVNKLSLRGRFLVIPCIAAVLLMALLFTSHDVISTHSRITTSISEENLAHVSELSKWVVYLQDNHSKLNRLLLTTAKSGNEELVYIQGREILNTLHRLETELTSAISTLGEEDRLFLSEQLAPAFSNYRNASISAIELATVDSNRAFIELLQADLSHQQLNGLFRTLTEHHVAALGEVSKLNQSLNDNQLFLSLIGVSLLVMLIITAFILSKRMTQDLDAVGQAIINLSHGDMQLNLKGSSDPYINNLQDAVRFFHQLLEEHKKNNHILNDTVIELKDSEDRLNSILKLVPTGILMINVKQEIVLFNAAAEEIFGYKREELLGKHVSLLLPDSYRTRHHYHVDKFAQGDAEIIRSMDRKPVPGQHKTGRELFVNASIASLTISSEKLMLAALTDVTEKKRHDDKILYQAHYDNLTRLPNRFLALDRLAQQLPKAKRTEKKLAILFVDLDDFKKVNDSMGHEVGDKILIEAASRLTSAVRKADTVGRLGGDEFIILLDSLQCQNDVRSITENLLALFRKPFLIDDRELIITLSIGIAFFPDDGQEQSELLRHADAAMYHSKQLGRNTYSFYTQQMNENVEYRLLLEEQLNKALERQEFELAYQPKYDIQTNQIVGAEALLRWRNQELGSVPPSEFIPVLEQTGLIVDVGEFVLNEALKQTALWRNQLFADFEIAINLSPRQFRAPDLVEQIQESIHVHCLPPEAVELEITEGVLLSGYAHTDEALKHLSQFGIKFALDDFGTGYSSLSYLRQYPFDVVKIDRSFIRDILTDEKDLALVVSSISMAQGLNLKAVAEGIETEEQLKALKDIGCPIGQGFLFSKPLTTEGMSALLLNESPTPGHET